MTTHSLHLNQKQKWENLRGWMNEWKIETTTTRKRKTNTQAKHGVEKAHKTHFTWSHLMTQYYKYIWPFVIFLFYFISLFFLELSDSILSHSIIVVKRTLSIFVTIIIILYTHTQFFLVICLSPSLTLFLSVSYSSWVSFLIKK